MLKKILSIFGKKHRKLEIKGLHHDNGVKHILMVEFNHPFTFQTGSSESLELMVSMHKHDRPRFDKANVNYIDEIVQVDDRRIKIDAFFDNDVWELIGVRWNPAPAVFTSELRVPDVLEEVLRGR